MAVMASTVSPAPGGLERVRAFANTLDVEDGLDYVASRQALAEWLRGERLVARDVAVTDDDVAQAARLRAALRAALLANATRGSIPPDAVATINDAAERAGLSLRFDDQAGYRMLPRTGDVPGALGMLVVEMAAAVDEGNWQRLKICANDACQWAFYDYSRARSGRWCSMQNCGNRAKQQAWRNRHG